MRVANLNIVDYYTSLVDTTNSISLSAITTIVYTSYWKAAVRSDKCYANRIKKIH